MDARHYNGLQVVAAGQFTAPQRKRLEAFTAAVGLLGKERHLDDLLKVANYIAGDA
jgi:hypothetical protein